MKAIAVAAALLVAACATGSAAPAPSPGAPTQPPPATQSGPTVTPTAAPAATPLATQIGGVAAQIVPLGADSTPIDLVYAFGSIWVASHHYDAVIRLDPTTLAEIARIPVDDGPGWFAVTDDALWVSAQLRRGLSRIDPATNSSEAHAGTWAPCWAPVVAFGSIWQTACDAGQVMRIDPATLLALDITVPRPLSLASLGDELLVATEDGLLRIDPQTNKLAPMGGPGGRAIGVTGGAVWISNGADVDLVDPETGDVLSTLPISHAELVTGDGDHAWLTRSDTPSVLEIDLATNDIVQNIEAGPEAVVARAAAGGLWITNYGGDSVWRLEP